MTDMLATFEDRIAVAESQRRTVDLLDIEPIAPTVTDRHRWHSRTTTWMTSHARTLVVLAVVFGTASVVFIVGIGRSPALSDDEGTYVAQAWAVRTHGTLAHYTYWYDHPPLGWLVLAPLTIVLHPLASLLRLDGHAVIEARFAMVVPALATTAMVYLLMRRVSVGRVASAVGTVAFILCPLTVSSLRQVYLDGLALPWLVAAFVLVATPARRLWAFALAGTCAALAVLSKETMIVAVPALIVGVWQQTHRRTRQFCLTAFTAAFVLVLLAYPLFALLKGELLPGPGHVSLVEAVRFQLAGRDSTGSALNPSSASYQLVRSWLAVDPWLLSAGAVAVPIGLAVRRLRTPTLAFVLFALVGARPGYLPQPYVIALLPFAAVVAAGAASWLWPHVARVVQRRNVLIRWVLTAALIFAVVPPAAAMGRTWARSLHLARSQDLTSPTITATRWIEGNVDHRARILVDDTFFVDLADVGFEPGLGVVWFYKTDFATNLDPSIIRQLPRGYRDFDYVVSTPVIRSAVEHNPARLEDVRRALQSSVVVATFGAGSGVVEVRQIVGPGSGSGRLSPVSP
jgi:hypothetical protein